MTDKLNTLQKTILSHNDGWQYEIICYDDQTEIIYSEVDNGVEETYSFPEGFDIQVFEAAIRLRKEYNETKS
jgi:hypothetical protein